MKLFELDDLLKIDEAKSAKFSSDLISSLQKSLESILNKKESPSVMISSIRYDKNKHERIGELSAPICCRHFHNELSYLSRKIGILYKQKAQTGNFRREERKKLQFKIEAHEVTFKVFSALKTGYLLNEVKYNNLTVPEDSYFDIAENWAIIRLKSFTCDHGLEISFANNLLRKLELPPLAA